MVEHTLRGEKRRSWFGVLCSVLRSPFCVLRSGGRGAAGVVALLAAGAAHLAGQSRAMDEHGAAARAAAGKDNLGGFDRLCTPPAPRPAAAARPAGPAAAPQRAAGPPARETWHVEPAKVFDNLY